MPDTRTIDKNIVDAVAIIAHFITETTGREPTSTEISNALKRYFVLNEIKAHIVMERESGEQPGESD